jgi:hypothetical protein
MEDDKFHKAISERGDHGQTHLEEIHQYVFSIDMSQPLRALCLDGVKGVICSQNQRMKNGVENGVNHVRQH